MSSSERVVLIAGSSSGIGRGIAHMFAKNGDQVIVHGSNKEKIDRVVDECNELSPNNTKAYGIVANLKDPKNAKTLVEETVAQFKALDVVVYSVGSYEFMPENANSNELYAYYERIRSVELDSAVELIQSAAEHLKVSNKNPNVVSIGSAEHIFPGSRHVLTAKAGLDMFMKCMAVEFAPKVRFNVIKAGSVMVEKYKEIYTEKEIKLFEEKELMKRYGKPEDVAEAVYLLASDKASWITGALMPVDGGASLHRINYEQED